MIDAFQVPTWPCQEGQVIARVRRQPCREPPIWIPPIVRLGCAILDRQRSAALSDIDAMKAKKTMQEGHPFRHQVALISTSVPKQRKAHFSAVYRQLLPFLHGNHVTSESTARCWCWWLSHHLPMPRHYQNFCLLCPHRLYCCLFFFSRHLLFPVHMTCHRNMCRPQTDPPRKSYDLLSPIWELNMYLDVILVPHKQGQQHAYVWDSCVRS
mmetsp:Transcript_7170/g.15968  ORF Transcript_7170/g.15968 Transcript_7170/m.15968 type:complete len:211 (+) Transcript_7170:354-986(+)